jgi:hypothetical protein
VFGDHWNSRACSCISLLLSGNHDCSIVISVCQKLLLEVDQVSFIVRKDQLTLAQYEVYTVSCLNSPSNHPYPISMSWEVAGTSSELATANIDKQASLLVVWQCVPALQAFGARNKQPPELHFEGE